MARFASDKTSGAMVLIALFAVFPAACQSTPDRAATPGGQGTGDLDFGEDWAGVGGRRRTDGARAARPGDAREHRSDWTIVLNTFSTEGHAQAAANMRLQVGSIDPKLSGARVHTTARGSMVTYGNYTSAEDPAAQADLKWIKAITISNRQVFAGAMLTRITRTDPTIPSDPLELMSVRARYPDINPLYTLQVAVWGDFESGKLTLAEIHQHAEAYARRLRTQGLNAYYDHDDDKRLSIVTVGLFDSTAIDPQIGLYSAEVQALMRRFPEHLVNGEPLQELIDRRTGRTRVQKPKLVRVP
ncbi:MAG: hypothetical protein ACYSTY_04540 [Planctomycetota bacterium]|jgi:hypothetical protein